MNTLITLRVNREGTFDISAAQRSDGQCGKQGQLTYKYFCTIEATNRSLTKEGYVMENLWTHEYFINRYVKNVEPVPSCERMAMDAIEYFRDLFKTNEELKTVDLRRIYIRIHGTDVSFIEVEWKKKTRILLQPLRKANFELPRRI